MKARRRPAGSWWRTAAVCASLACAMAWTQPVLAAFSAATHNMANSLGTGSISAPTSVTATGGALSASVTWTLPPVAQRGLSQTVLHKVNAGAYTVVASGLSATATAYTDSGLGALSTVCYEVRTVYGGWTATSAPSNCVSVLL